MRLSTNSSNEALTPIKVPTPYKRRNDAFYSSMNTDKSKQS